MLSSEAASEFWEARVGLLHKRKHLPFQQQEQAVLGGGERHRLNPWTGDPLP